jgi:phosphatidylglycerophosphate synthase
MANNTLKYRRLDTAMRQASQQKWNQPLIWPVLLLVLLILIMVMPAVMVYKHKKHKKQLVPVN